MKKLDENLPETQKSSLVGRMLDQGKHVVRQAFLVLFPQEDHRFEQLLEGDLLDDFEVEFGEKIPGRWSKRTETEPAAPFTSDQNTSNRQYFEFMRVFNKDKNIQSLDPRLREVLRRELMYRYGIEGIGSP